MTDLALIWDDAGWRADLAVASGDLACDEGLWTAVILSLFTDAPARADDALPLGADARGWWGDALAELPGDVTGSRLWLLSREKQLPAALRRTEDYAREALAWLVEDGVAAAVDCAASNPKPGVRALGVTITRADRTAARFDFVWDAT